MGINSLRESFLLIQDSCHCQTDCYLLQDRFIASAGLKAYMLSEYYFFLLRFTGHLSDRLKVFAGQNEKNAFCQAVLHFSRRLYKKSKGSIRTGQHFGHQVYEWVCFFKGQVYEG